MFPTIACDLIGTSSPYNLCQNLTLQAGKKYNTSFDLFSNENKNVGVTSAVYYTHLDVYKRQAQFLRKSWHYFYGNIIS